VLTVLAHLKSAAAGPHRLPHARRLGGVPCPEKVEPQLLVGSNPQSPLVDSDEDGCLRNGIGVEVVELHAVVVRERPHEPVRQKAEATLVKRHEAHDVTVARPWLWLARRSDPLRPIGVGHRTKESAIDGRLKHLHGDIRWIPRGRLDDNNVAGHECGGGFKYGGESLSLPLSLSTSPFSLLLPGARCSSNGSRRAELM